MHLNMKFKASGNVHFVNLTSLIFDLIKCPLTRTFSSFHKTKAQNCLIGLFHPNGSLLPVLVS